MITEFFINENAKIFELEILREYIKKLESEETTILKAMPIKKELEIMQGDYFIRLTQNSLIPEKFESFFVEIYDEENNIKEEVSFIYNNTTKIKENWNFYIIHSKIKKEEKETLIITDSYSLCNNKLDDCITEIKTMSTKQLEQYIEKTSSTSTIDEMIEYIYNQGFTKEDLKIIKKRTINFFKINKNIQNISKETQKISDKELKLSKIINSRK